MKAVDDFFARYTPEEFCQMLEDEFGVARGTEIASRSGDTGIREKTFIPTLNFTRQTLPMQSGVYSGSRPICEPNWITSRFPTSFCNEQNDNQKEAA